MQAWLGAELGALFGALALSAALALEDGFALTLRAREAPCIESLVPLARAGEVPAETLGASTATALVYRDFARFFSQRAELFPPETLPRLRRGHHERRPVLRGPRSRQRGLARALPLDPARRARTRVRP